MVSVALAVSVTVPPSASWMVSDAPMIVADAPIRVMVSDEAVITSALPTLKATPVAVSVSVDALPKVSCAAAPSVIVSALPLTIAAAPAASVTVPLVTTATSPLMSDTVCLMPATVAVSLAPKEIAPALPVRV